MERSPVNKRRKAIRGLRVLTPLVAVLIFLMHKQILKHQKRGAMQHLANVILNTPTFPEPVRVSSIETNYYNFLLTLRGVKDSGPVSTDDIIQVISSDMMRRYVSPLISTDRYRSDLPYESAEGVIQCGKMLVSNIVVAASTESSNETPALLCARLQWIVNGLRNENQSTLRWTAIDLEAEIIRCFLGNNIKSLHTILPLLPFVGVDYLSGTCDLLSSEIMETVDFSRNDYEGKKEQVKRSLQPVFDRLASLPTLSKNNENSDLAQFIVDLKQDLQTSDLTARDKNGIARLFDLVLLSDLQLSRLKQRMREGRGD
jgi:hypothetical protein